MIFFSCNVSNCGGYQVNILLSIEIKNLP